MLSEVQKAWTDKKIAKIRNQFPAADMKNFDWKGFARECSALLDLSKGNEDVKHIIMDFMREYEAEEKSQNEQQGYY